jgi:endonuclease/exonuclease/phosphatase family metal-dependent hydrolase
LDWLKQIFSFLFLIGIFTGSYGCQSFKPSGHSDQFRVMTMNIHHGEGLDRKIDLARIAKIIDDARADIVALQEVDRDVERSGKRDIIVELSDLTGMAYAFGKTIEYQGGEYGNAILTRCPIIQEKNVLFHRQGKAEQRGLMQLIVDVDGTEIVIFNTHLDDREEADRLNAVKEICTAVSDYGTRPLILMGDFNDSPDGNTVSIIKETMHDLWQSVGEGDGFSYPADKPAERIDYIFSSIKTGPKPVHAQVISADASDHLPVAGRFSLEQSKAEP